PAARVTIREKHSHALNWTHADPLAVSTPSPTGCSNREPQTTLTPHGVLAYGRGAHQRAVARQEDHGSIGPTDRLHEEPAHQTQQPPHPSRRRRRHHSRTRARRTGSRKRHRAR